MELSGEINARILDIWYDPVHRLSERQPRMPRVYPLLTPGGLLVVGLNPSFSKRAFKQLLIGEQWEGFDAGKFFAWRDSPKDFDLERACLIEQLALDNYAHYAPFSNLASALNTHWNYLDVFLLRETSAKAVFPQVMTGRPAEWRYGDLNPFGKAQADLCADVIMRLDPKVIVVANAAASQVLSTAMETTFDDSLGHHMARLGSRMVSTFFSSMWTGERSLDRYNRARLIWQIKKAFVR